MPNFKKLSGILLFLCLFFPASLLSNPICILDLKYLTKYNLDDEEKVKEMWDILHATTTLQGIVNRKSPQLYIHYVEKDGVWIDDYWWDKYRQKGQWLAGRDTYELKDIVEAISKFRKMIKGVVVYDSNVASTSNIASSLAGVEDLIAVRYDTSPNSLYSRIVSGGLKLPIVVSLVNKNGESIFTGKGKIYETDIPSTGSKKNDAYIWFIEKYVKKGKCNTEYAAYYIDQYWRTKPKATASNHHQLTNHDFFISKKAFFFDLSPWGDEPSTDEQSQPEGTDLNTLKLFLTEAYEQNKGKKFCYIGGFPSWAFKYTQHAGGKHEDVATEWEFSRIISAYNAFKDADAIGLGALANSSFWQHFPLKKQYKQRWVTRDELKKRGYIDENGKVNFAGRNFIIFYVGDYDSSAWVTQTTPGIWDNSDRGAIPLMWCISPVLQERVPMVLHNYRETATANDYFAAADNGAGYLMPGMLQEPRPISSLPSGLDAWAKHCKKYYKIWDLTITGFVIDGHAPGLDQDGLDCYASFSPNGIVPQKIPLTLLHKNMPVIRSDYDLVDHDPKLATNVILDRVRDRPIQFHWFRAILKSPTWYKEISEELKRRNSNVEILDAPTFFELYRLYLEQNPDAADGGIE
jgi:hypothetical protein